MKFRAAIPLLIKMAMLYTCLPAQGVTWQPIASVGEHAPGVPGQPIAEFSALREPVVNDESRIAFNGRLSFLSVDDGNTDTIWTASDGALELLAREGDTAPGTTETFEIFGSEPLINNVGQVLVDAIITGPTESSDGLWIGTPGNLQLLARSGVPTSSSHMIQFLSLSSVSLSDNGSAAFLANANNNNTAIWHAEPGNVTAIAMEDSPVPTGSGLPSGTTFNSLLAPGDSPVINAGGTVAFQAIVDHAPSFIFDATIWTGTPGNLQLLARENAPAPGLPGIDFFLLGSEPSLNDAGQVAFNATLSDSNLSGSIWLGRPGELRPLVKDGDSAIPGVAGVEFDSLGFGPQIRLSNSGHVAFVSDLVGSNVDFESSTGIFIASDEGVELVARAGDAATGMAAGTVFEGFDTLSINSSGRVAFTAYVSGGGVDVSQDEGVWAQDSQGELQLVARTGDWVHPFTGHVFRLADVVDPTALEDLGYLPIRSLSMRSASPFLGESGTAWNDDNILGLKASYTNLPISSTIFLANVGSTSGDFDFDGDVDGNDLLFWQRGGSPNSLSTTDLAAWQANYGVSAPLATTSTTVPEPASIALISAALALLCARGCNTCDMPHTQPTNLAEGISRIGSI